MKKTRNNFEKRVARQLKRAKVPFKYEPEKIPYILARHYIPDFVLTTSTGKIYIETKGHLRREDKAKMVAVKRQHPNLDIRIVFYAKNKHQIRWADRHGFIYAFERVPVEWLS